MKFIDTHAHLSDKAFDVDREAIISSLPEKKIEFVFEILCEPADWQKMALFPENFYFALGIHPEYADRFKEEDLTLLENKLKEKKVLFLGELGLDYYWVNDNKQRQKDLLLRQLDLAQRNSKPCVFHCRNWKNPQEHNAYEDLLDILQNYFKNKAFSKRGILHSFSGTEKDAFRAVDLGFLLGINGTFTYPKNKELREIVKKVGIENIVFETDCPYLPPQSLRGKRNTPLNIPEIAYEIAAFCGLSVKVAAEKAYNNSLKFFIE